MKSYEKLLIQNKVWVRELLAADSDYFKKLAELQKPKFLWIGASDSRVPANIITGTSPGEIFVHRNIANMVLHSDLNMISVLQYAVEVLEVKHVIVCGHYGCSGIKAAMDNKDLEPLNNWLQNIREVYHLHQNELEVIKDEESRENRLVELNVKEQVLNLAKMSIIQKSLEE